MTSNELQIANTQLAPVEKALETAKQNAIGAYRAIASNEDSLARRVYYESEDKNNPISLPILEYLQQNGFIKLSKVSQLPSLNAQGRYEEIYAIMTEPGVMKLLFQDTVQQLNSSYLSMLRARTRGAQVIAEGLKTLGISDEQLTDLLHRNDLSHFIEYASKNYPTVFSGIPTSGPDLPVQQLEYYTKWISAIKQLGLSQVRKECRDHGIDDFVLDGEGGPDKEVTGFTTIPNRKWIENQLQTGANPVTKAATITGLSRQYWISPAIQSIDLYAQTRKSSFDESIMITRMFAFVELTKPKGLRMTYCDVRDLQDKKASEQMGALLTSGQFHRAPFSVEQLPAYQEWLKTRPNADLDPLLGWLGIGTFTGLLTAAFTTWSAAFLGPMIGGSIGLRRFFVKSARDQETNKSISNLVSRTFPFPGLQFQGQDNYVALYQLEERLIKPGGKA